MSILIKAFSLSKSWEAKALDNSVFPTPVGPKNKKLAIGLLGSLSPVLDLCIAEDIDWTALSWPITFFWSWDSRLSNFSISVWASLLTGIDVHFAIISATSSAKTSSLKSDFSAFWEEFFRLSSFDFKFCW